MLSDKHKHGVAFLNTIEITPETCNAVVCWVFTGH